MQFFRFVNVDKKEKCERNFYPLMLTDYSYIGDEYCNDILSLLSDEWQGDRVLHIGDYASPNDNTNTEKVISEINKKFNYKFSIYSYAETFNDVVPCNEKKQIRYVYNLDKKEYLDLYHQPIINIGYSFSEVHFLKYNSFALLTACGNGLGGGDYDGCNVEEVGKWAGDHFVASEKKLEKYNDFEEYNKVFYDTSKFRYNLDESLNINKYDEYNEELIKKGIDTLNNSIMSLKKFNNNKDYELLTYNLTDDEKKELYSRKIDGIKYKRDIKNKDNKNDLCL